MTAQGMQAFPAREGAADLGPSDPVSILGAVREDVRQTLRTAWIDPGLEVAARHPAFFTTAWSAIRPNVGKSFLLLAASLRTQAAEATRWPLQRPDLRALLAGDLADEELRRIQDAVRAAHLASAKVQIVVHVLYRAVSRERLPGTGREEPPIRRGVPDWQRWMASHRLADPALAVAEELAVAMGMPTPPSSLLLLARWPTAMTALCDEARTARGGSGWRSSAARLRRTLIGGIGTLPHPIDLQWMALSVRGFREEDRLVLAEKLAAQDASMADQTLLAGFAWNAFGGPDLGVEG